MRFRSSSLLVVFALLASPFNGTAASASSGPVTTTRSPLHSESPSSLRSKGYQKVDRVISGSGFYDGHLFAKVHDATFGPVYEDSPDYEVYPTVYLKAKFTGANAVSDLSSKNLEIGVKRLSHKYCTRGHWHGYCLVYTTISDTVNGGSKCTATDSEAYFSSESCHVTYEFQSIDLPKRISKKRFAVIWRADLNPKKRTILTRS